jgi:hypothetical protein
MHGLWQSGCFCGRLTGLTQPPGEGNDTVQCGLLELNDTYKGIGASCVAIWMLPLTAHRSH